MLHTVTVVLLLVAGFEYSNACTCAPAHLQTLFCSSDYVMKVRVRSSEDVYIKEKTDFTENNETETRTENVLAYRKYHVDVMRMFKVKENEAGLRKNSTVAVLYTPAYESLCGAFLNLKNKYLIGGHFEGPKTSINICELVTPWPWVSKRQRKNLLFLYEDNCHCQIENDFEMLETADKCQWKEMGERMKKCYERDSACITNKNSLTGGCKWHRNKHLRACRESAQKPIMP